MLANDEGEVLAHRRPKLREGGARAELDEGKPPLRLWNFWDCVSRAGRLPLIRLGLWAKKPPLQYFLYVLGGRGPVKAGLKSLGRAPT